MISKSKSDPCFIQRSFSGRLQHTKVTGKAAMRLWSAIYKKRKFTDRGRFWEWAEIDGTVPVFVHCDGGDLLSPGKIEIYIG